MYVQRNTYGTKGFVVRQLISDVFPGLPSNIDAVTTWTWNDKMYFFKGKLLGTLILLLNWFMASSCIFRQLLQLNHFTYVGRNRVLQKQRNSGTVHYG